MSFTHADYLAMQARLSRNRPQIGPAVTPTGQLECELQDEIESYLKTLAPEIWWDRKRMDKATTSRCGVPDFVGCYKGIPFGFEVKRPGEKASTEQLGELAWLNKAGAQTAIVTSKGEVMAIIKSMNDRISDPAKRRVD